MLDPASSSHSQRRYSSYFNCSNVISTPAPEDCTLDSVLQAIPRTEFLTFDSPGSAPGQAPDGSARLTESDGEN